MTAELPLFPLNMVLFPRMLVPLHIFEERYKAMIRYCVEHNSLFGIVLIRAGEEVGGPAVPYDVGTKALIMRLVELEDERKYIIVRGMGRFIIRRLTAIHPYLVGEVDDLPLETGGADNRLLAQVEMTFYRYLRLLKQAQGISVSISNVPDDPEGIAWMVAWGLQVDLELRQELLSAMSLQELLEKEQVLLENENRVLQILCSKEIKRRVPPEHLGHFSLN